MQQKPTSNILIDVMVWIILIIASVGTFIIIDQLGESAVFYTDAQQELEKPEYSGSVGKVDLSDQHSEFNIPSWSLFQTGNIWTLISKAKPVDTAFVPNDLADVPVSHGDSSTPMKLSARAIEPLKEMFAAAESAGYPLAVSSGYRSADEQQRVRDEFSREQGQAAADQYVAEPGSSEHQTGLAIDLSTYSAQCLANSDDCGIDTETANWLAEHAHDYGFIQRYPPGSSSITGVAYERWHYRYVGIVLARAIHESGLTFDEFVQLAR